MGKRTQVEPNTGIDRRQLLVSAATATLAGVGPSQALAPAAAAMNPVPMRVAQLPVLDVCASKVCKIEEIAAQNRVRQEARLCLLQRNCEESKRSRMLLSSRTSLPIISQRCGMRSKQPCCKQKETHIGDRQGFWKGRPGNRRSIRLYANGLSGFGQRQEKQIVVAEYVFPGYPFLTWLRVGRCI
jgi:hypothetical protein